MLGIWTQDRRMVVVVESTELWRPLTLQVCLNTVTTIELHLTSRDSPLRHVFLLHTPLIPLLGQVASVVVVRYSFAVSWGKGAEWPDCAIFYNFFATNCLTKVAQIFWWIFGLFQIMSLLCKKNVATFWGKLGNCLFQYLVTLEGSTNF